MEKIILLSHKRASTEGSPVYERINAYETFFQSQKVEVIHKTIPKTIKEYLQLLFDVYIKKTSTLLISMPPFKGWPILFLPFTQTILDIRDGWSIAIRTGYGGTKAPSRLKAFCATQIEKIAIKRSSLTVTCTPGLKKYLEQVSSTNIVLITNGYSKERFRQVVKHSSKEPFENSRVITCVCAGKFAEYGKDRAIQIIEKLVDNTPSGKQIKLMIIGADFIKNSWIDDYIQEEKLQQKIKVQLIERIPSSELLTAILHAQIGICVVRNPEYEFGTKIFDYILCGIPVFNYFDEPNNFTIFFKDFLTPTISYQKKKVGANKIFLRSQLLSNNKEMLMNIFKNS